MLGLGPGFRVRNRVVCHSLTFASGGLMLVVSVVSIF